MSRGVEDLRARLQQSLSDRYRLGRELGRGGMAVVYLADDVKHHRQVAIKVLKPELVPALGAERFLREIEIAARLTHPNILPLHDSGEAGGLLYYVMPYLEGETLRDRLAREKQLPLEEALAIATEVADALAYAHSHGVVHRDIKPGNVLFQAEHAVVSDFGIARAVSQAGGEHLTESGLAVGTLAYMSPEQASGARDVDGRTDIYSLGCVLYEMLAGEPPLLSPDMSPQPSRDGVSLRGSGEAIPAAVAEVLARALARQPVDRFATALEFKQSLQSSTTGGHGLGSSRGMRALVRRPWLVAASTLVVALLLFLPQTRHFLWRLGGVARESDVIRLAVLPFENLTGDPGQEYFSDGLTEEMTTQLGRLHPEGLAVIAPTSAARYKHTTESVRQIGRELAVQYLLKGSARREAGTVKVTGELIRVRDQATVWTDSYQREAAGILTLQSDVARAIARSLALTLLPQEQARLARTQAVNTGAYDDYLKGLERLHTLTRPGLDAAQQYFESALRKDPDYALAYSGLSYVWGARQQMGFVAADSAGPRMRAAALRAIALDSLLPEAHWHLGGLKASTDWDWAGAGVEYRKALELDPNLAEARAHYANLLIVTGRRSEALAQAERAVALDPLNQIVRLVYAMALLNARRYDDALEQANLVLRTAPGNPAAMSMRFGVYVSKRMWPEAFAAERARFPGDDSAGLVALDRAYAAGGFRSAMRQAAARQAGSRHRTPADVDIAHLYLLGNDTSRAFTWLERAYTSHSPGLASIAWLPFYDPIRSSPHLQDLLRRMGLPGA